MTRSSWPFHEGLGFEFRKRSAVERSANSTKTEPYQQVSKCVLELDVETSLKFFRIGVASHPNSIKAPKGVEVPFQPLLHAWLFLSKPFLHRMSEVVETQEKNVHSPRICSSQIAL